MTEEVQPDPPSPRPTTAADTLSDPELIALVRAGDSDAYEELFLRHREVAIRYARRLADSERAEDLCAEAFTKILDLLQRGKGPEVSFRAYLLTTVRTSHLNTLRTGGREILVPDHEPIGRMVPVVDDPDARFDRDAICRAFYRLPGRWQAALWLTEVEGLSHNEASKHLGIATNAVASLTFRARAGLRQAYLAEHLLETTDPTCRAVVEQLPRYLRNRTTSRRRRLIEEHLKTCSSCTAVAVELSGVDSNLGALIAPLALAGFAVSGSGLGLTALVGNAKAWGSSLSGLLSTKAAAVAAVAALGVGVGAEVIGQHHVDQAPKLEPPVSRTTPFATRPSPSGRPTPAGVIPTASAALPSNQRPKFAAAAPSAADAAVPAPRPSPSASASTTVAPRTMAIGSPTDTSYQKSGFQWQQVLVPIDAPIDGTTLEVTTDRTIQTTTATTAGTGWVCGTPTVQWNDGTPYASTKFRCIYDTTGNGEPLRFDYQVAPKATMTALLTPPAGYADASLLDNVLTFLLRS